MKRVLNRNVLFTLSLYLFSTTCFARASGTRLADSASLLAVYADSLKELQYEKVKPHTSIDQKLKANTHFKDILEKALSLPGSFDYPFDSLTTISRLTSPDKQFRIITWNIPKPDGGSYYFGFIQSLNPIKKAYELYTLEDKSTEITNQQNATYTADKWLGMLYYKIIPEKYEDKTIYVMLAWQGYSKIISHKIIDVLYFNNQGVPAFGKTIFRKPPPGWAKSSAKRIIFQYASTAFMSVEYNEKKNMIYYDHLGPIDDDLLGQYQYYAPSFQVDGLIWKNAGWEYQENVDARNPASASDKNYHPEGENFKEKKKPIYTPH